MIADYGYSADFGRIYLDGWIDISSEIFFEDRPQDSAGAVRPTLCTIAQA
jgi:hypothetical protein